MPTLFEKSGAEGDYRRFKFELHRIVLRNELPEFHLAWEAGQGAGARAGAAEPLLRMTRRSALAFDHPGYELPRKRQGGRAVARRS